MNNSRRNSPQAVRPCFKVTLCKNWYFCAIWHRWAQHNRCTYNTVAHQNNVMSRKLVYSTSRCFARRITTQNINSMPSERNLIQRLEHPAVTCYQIPTIVETGWLGSWSKTSKLTTWQTRPNNTEVQRHKTNSNLERQLIFNCYSAATLRLSAAGHQAKMLPTTKSQSEIYSRLSCVTWSPSPFFS